MAIQGWTGSGVVGPVFRGKGKAMHRTRSESWSQESVRAGAVDAMGGSCAESPDNQSRAVATNARSNLDRLCWREVLARDRECIRARMGIPRAGQS